MVIISYSIDMAISATNSKKGMLVLAVGALGVVFGDIGTSPLYALQALFGPLGSHIAVNTTNVYGVISLVIWSIIIIVSIEFVGFIMRADNKGEGGIMSLVALIKNSRLPQQHQMFFIFLGLVGVALFYGDSTITPAISVLSAVEGLKSISPNLTPVVIPTTLVLLTGLFWSQKFGTAAIGRIFGPVMLTWFVVIGVAGGLQIWYYPAILVAVSPVAAISFIISQPLLAFVAMGAVILAITGAEALYADMGHFGRPPIARAWFLLVFPALLLCYMGQGAVLLQNPLATTNPFMALFADSLQIPIVLLATAATLIASQSVISGAFSLTRQAIQLGFIPRMRIEHTSDRESGQIYVPFINFSLFLIVGLLVILFGSSEKLAGAYGIAVGGTLAIDTILFLAVARIIRQTRRSFIAIAAAIFGTLDAFFIAANIDKVLHGGWFPLGLSSLAFILIHSWIMGQAVVTQERRALEGPLQLFIDKIHAMEPPLKRVPGTAVYIGHHADLAPLALHTAVEKLRELHDHVVILTVHIVTAAHVPETKRAIFDKLAYNDGISHLNLYYGYHDHPNIPRTLLSLRSMSPELDFDSHDVNYFVSLSKIVPTGRSHLSNWRKSLYCLMSRNALSTSDYYKLPVNRTVEMRSLIEL